MSLNFNDLNPSMISNNKGDNESSSINWNDDYSQKLANFMKSSNELLKNKKRTQNIISTQAVISNEIDISKKSESPLNSLFFNDFKHVDDEIKTENKPNIAFHEKYLPIFDENGNNSECGNKEIIHKKKNMQHNFQEALRMDDLESQVNKLQKQLTEKNKLIEDLQSELLTVKQKNTTKKCVYRNLATEYCNDFATITATINELPTNSSKVKSEEISGQNTYKEDFCKKNLLEFSSIENYNPDSPVALKNKIKDLESQIQDLQEANEIASHFVSNIKNEESDFSNEVLSDLIGKNQILQDEIHNLRQNAIEVKSDLVLSKVMRNELENLKLGVSALKHKNDIIIEENIKLKKIVKNHDSKSDKKVKSKKKLIQSEFENSSKPSKHLSYSGKHLLEKNSKLLSNENFLNDKYNRDLSQDSTDSMLSDINHNTESIKFINELVPIRIPKEIINDTCDDSDNVTFGTNEILSCTDSDSLRIESFSNQLSKFSTLGRTAFAPRAGSDIIINDVVKFIRQGGRISKGLVHFIGHLPKRNDIYLGIELEIEEGKHNGIYDGIRYFQCRENKGVFVAFNKIIMVYSKNVER